MRLLLAAVLLVATTFAVGQRSLLPKPVITLFAGPEKDTYVQIAKDLQTVCPAFDVTIKETQGSIENMDRLVTNPTISTGHRLAIVQADVFMRIQGTVTPSPTIISPLYMEDLSIITSTTSGVHGIRDLAGKRVAVGTRHSGTWASAETLRIALGISWNAYELSPNDSIMSLLVGDIDAMIIMAGHPVPLLKDLGPSVREFIHFIDITNTKLSSIWSTTLVPRFYEWQPTPVQGIATRSLLLAAHDVPPSVTAGIRQCLKDNLTTLRKLGHPKWKDVELR